ncbi:MAG TPA: RNase A-like domain-containing protein [Actinomycetales bacterium]|nr:RNase A-like domain-containing protein [Actinomycetales bacterium]
MTATAMPVPDVDTGAAGEAADRLRQVSRLTAAAREVLEQNAPQDWRGSASTGYLDQRGRASGRLDATAGFARSLSTAIDRYADAVRPATLTMRRAGADLELALTRQAAADEADRATAARLVSHAWDEYDRGKRAYDWAVADLMDAVSAVPEFQPDPADSTHDHLSALGRRFWNQAVAEPFAGAKMLAFGWVDDPEGWRAMVSGIPGSVWDQATHPVRTVDEMLAGDDWRSGQYGAAVGSALSMAAVHGKVVKAMASPEVRARYARNMADPNAPRPRVQTADEMLAGVHLAAHEHHDLGHAVRRHVDVDDDYLRDRLENGTLEDGGTRGPIPPDASSFRDLATAERAITEVLKAYEADVRALASGEVQRLRAMTMTFDEPLGRVMSPDDGRFTVRESAKIRVVLVSKDGTVFIKSAYLEVP